MKKGKIVCAAILLSSCIGWIGCKNANETNRNTSTDRGAPTNPQGPSGPAQR